MANDAVRTAADWIKSRRARWERLFDVVGEYVDEFKERR
jgi:hypothetical protein